MADRRYDILEAIGHTPLVQLKSLSMETGCQVFAKLEFLNPMGSIKDRVARYLKEQDPGIQVIAIAPWVRSSTITSAAGRIWFQAPTCWKALPTSSPYRPCSLSSWTMSSR